MPKISHEMLELGRPPRLDSAWRTISARDANRLCSLMLTAILDERFPTRVAWPKDLVGKVVKLQNDFFEEAAFLFDIATCRGLPEEPTQSVFNAFLKLLESDTVHNVKDGYEVWETWYPVHWGEYRLYTLFDEQNAKAVNPKNDPAITAMFYRAYELMHRIHIIECYQEDPICLDVMYIMPEVVRFCLQGTPNIENVTYQRPWLLVTEQYVVYRHHLAKELGYSYRRLQDFERDGATKKRIPWPKPLNPEGKHDKKYYDPLEVLDLLTRLPKDFSGHTPIDNIIEKLMKNHLATKITPKSPKATQAQSEGG